MSRTFLIIFCGLLLASNAFSTDVLLPAVFSMERAFSAPIEQVQIAMPLFMFASAFGQLVYGSASDRFGRKPVLLIGLTLYSSAAIVALLAPNVEVLLASRAVQGFGSAAGIVIGRAILRDRYAGTELARMMAFAMAVISFAPILAPLAGTGLVAVGGWQFTFVAMAVFGALLAAVAVWKLEETNQTLRPNALDWPELVSASGRVLRHPQSRFFLIVAAALAFTVISFISHAPRFFKSAFGWEGLTFALAFSAMGTGIILGQFLNSKAIARYGVMATTRGALGILAGACLAILMLSRAGWLSPVAFAMLMFIFNGCFLSALANAASLTLDPHPNIAGLASSLFGFITQLVPAIAALATLRLIGGDIGTWAGLAALLTTGVWIALWRHQPLRSRVQPVTH